MKFIDLKNHSAFEDCGASLEDDGIEIYSVRDGFACLLDDGIANGLLTVTSISVEEEGTVALLDDENELWYAEDVNVE